MRLNALVFCAGAGSLATEIAARLLAPYYGSSTVVWANVIGLVLASLSLGYWLGGRLADRRPEPRLLGAIVLCCRGHDAVVTFVARPLLDISVEASTSCRRGGDRLLLRRPPALRATRDPPRDGRAVRDPSAISNVADAGSVAGRLYALSTIGSLLGTFSRRSS